MSQTPRPPAARDPNLPDLAAPQRPAARHGGASDTEQPLSWPARAALLLLCVAYGVLYGLAYHDLVKKVGPERATMMMAFGMGSPY
jgi:hypothetical protein